MKPEKPSPAALGWRSPHGRPLPPIGQRTLVMGILNVTPDSFSDGGQLKDADALMTRAAEMIAAGADLLDIGGESTRPGAAPVGEGEELARVLPAIRALRARWPDLPLSVDTFKPRVAEAAVHAGADIVNDVWGLLHGFDLDAHARIAAELATGGPANAPSARSPMAAAIARLGCPVVLMHNRPERTYAEFWADFLSDLRLSANVALHAGVQRHQIWLDPGFGFAKSPGQNLDVIKHLDRVVGLGYPVLVGTSRKSTIGRVLGTEVNDRIEGTAATMAWSIAQGCHMIRVHDVKQMARIARMTDAIKAGIDVKLPEIG